MTPLMTPTGVPLPGSIIATEYSRTTSTADSSRAGSAWNAPLAIARCHQSSSDCTKSDIRFVVSTLKPLRSVKKIAAKSVWVVNPNRYARSSGYPPRARLASN